MVQDGKRSPTSTLDDLDLPPAYDIATAPAFEAGGPSSSSSSSAAPVLSSRQPPKHLAHLFASPSNAEPLLGRPTAPAAILESIDVDVKSGVTISLDPRLEDPEVLYDFIRMQALVPPKVMLHCIGAHTEIPERDETTCDADGTIRTKRKGQPERIVDFDLTIDLNGILDHPANKANIHLFTMTSSNLEHRGTHQLTYGATFAPEPRLQDGYVSVGDELSVTDVGRPATRKENDEFMEWLAFRDSKGLPGWVNPKECSEFLESGSKSSGIRLEESGNVDVDVEAARRADNEGPALKAWCHKYAADRGLLKEFWLQKQVWGWDRNALLTAVKGAILSTGYVSNDLSVSFEYTNRAVIVRPANLLSRMLNHTLIYALLWITLIYPIIWIWQRLHPRGGGPYNVASASYGMKYYPALPSTFPSETLEAAQNRLPGMYKIHPELPHPTRLQPGPKGIHYLLGRKEGEWFREWEDRIRMGVRMRYKGLLEGGGEGEDESGRQLDGYDG
ncbi:hypothetical protein BCR39DRAFT_532672 [Naematelia encephala]|uniref:Uncharacterized protein n=1 Tax=Naematelia encephala TaxID=71784 RepID=A0A1Y2B303_9TREE|nr:hypothetical protein BCR39DRAFT_532672 [Naematelia encephala]